MYNLLEYSDNYPVTSGSLRNNYRDEINDDANQNVSNWINNNKAITSKSFEYKTKLIGSTPDDNNILDAEVVVPLKYFCNFWRSFYLQLINCEIELDFSRSKECIISEILVISAVPVIQMLTHLFGTSQQYKQLFHHFKKIMFQFSVCLLMVISDF